MKLIILTWKHCFRLGENPECRALGCHCILFPGQKVYRTNNEHGADRFKFFCRDCIEKKAFVIDLLTRNSRLPPLNPTLQFGILPANRAMRSEACNS